MLVLLGSPGAASRLRIEGDPDTPILAPGDMTGAFQMVGRHDQDKAVWDEERGHDFKRGPGLRKIAHGAVDRAAAERDRSGLQDTPTRCNPVLIHRAGVPPKRENSLNTTSGQQLRSHQTAK